MAENWYHLFFVAASTHQKKAMLNAEAVYTENFAVVVAVVDDVAAENFEMRL